MSGDNSSNGQVIDKNALYGNYLSFAKEQQEIYSDAVRMALDVPRSPGAVTANRVNFINPPQVQSPLKSGMSGLAKLAIGAAMATGIGGLGLGAMAFLRPAQQIEKVIPGKNSETSVRAGETILE